MKFIEQFKTALTYLQITIDLTSSKRDPFALILELRERNQSAREQVLAIREAVTALTEENFELKKTRATEAVELQFSGDKLIRTVLETGTTVYQMVLVSEVGAEHIIYYCANCFENGTRSLLQPHDVPKKFGMSLCPACGVSVKLVKNPPATIYNAGRSIDFDGYL